MNTGETPLDRTSLTEKLSLQSVYNDRDDDFLNLTQDLWRAVDGGHDLRSNNNFGLNNAFPFCQKNSTDRIDSLRDAHSGIGLVIISISHDRLQIIGAGLESVLDAALACQTEIGFALCTSEEKDVRIKKRSTKRKEMKP